MYVWKPFLFDISILTPHICQHSILANVFHWLHARTCYIWHRWWRTLLWSQATFLHIEISTVFVNEYHPSLLGNHSSSATSYSWLTLQAWNNLSPCWILLANNNHTVGCIFFKMYFGYILFCHCIHTLIFNMLLVPCFTVWSHARKHFTKPAGLKCEFVFAPSIFRAFM